MNSMRMPKRIKRLPNIDRRAYKGLFKPLNPQKYKGNHKNIIYRSSWEKRFMGYCDKKKVLCYIDTLLDRQVGEMLILSR